MSIIIAKTFWVTELDSDLQHNVWFWTYTFSIFFYWSSQVIISRTAKVVFTAYSQAQYFVAVAFSVEIMSIGCTSKNTRLSDTCVLCITVWFSLHYHLLRSLFRWEQDIHMHWIHGRQVSVFLSFFYYYYFTCPCSGRDIRDLSSCLLTVYPFTRLQIKSTSYRCELFSMLVC